MATEGCARAGIPAPRSVLDALRRPRLSMLLERQAGLTVVHAPRGFGKRTLVAGWLHDGGAAHREVIWTAGPAVPVPANPGSPCVIVVEEVPASDAARVLEAAAAVLEQHSGAIVVVTVHGTVEPPPSVTARGLDCTWIDAALLCFTAGETAELCRRRGLHLGDDRCAELHDALGGVPPLTLAAVAALQTAPANPVDGDNRLAPAVEKAVNCYVEQRLSNLDARTRAAVPELAPLRACTVAEAAAFTGDPDCEATIARLDTEGLLLGSYDGVACRWSWPAAVRRIVLAQAAERDDNRLEQVLAEIAAENLAAGRHAEAAAYALDAQAWDLAVHLVEEHWAHFVDDRFPILVELLRTIPDEVAADHPSVAVGKALFVQSLSGHPMLSYPIPDDPAELDVLGAGPDASETLHVGAVQAIGLRMAGNMREASDRARPLTRLVEAMFTHQPHNVTTQLPFLRLQWAIGMQLAGDLPESTVEFEHTYRDGLVAGYDFVVLNSAGSIAANWALLGDLPRARSWLEAESRVDTSVGYWDEMIRVGGRVATALTHLDGLDTGAAKTALDALGIPSATEELWSLIAYAHAQYALTTGDAYAGLTQLHRIIGGHRTLHQDGALSHALLTAAEIDLNLALGNGNVARALVDSGTGGNGDHPLLVVAAARTELLAGAPDEARSTLNRVSWPDCGWLRAHLEALLIEAAACHRTEPDAAALAFGRAVALADTLGNRRVFATLAPTVLQELTGLLAAPARAVAARIPVTASVFPAAVSQVRLTARETELLVHLDRGVARRDLADTLFVSYNTIKAQLRSIYRKLGTHNITDTLARARELRLLDREQSD